MRAARALLELRRWGATLAGGYASAAARSPDAIALVDERGALTFGEVNERAELIARALVADGIEPGDDVALLARNGRGFVLAATAAGRAGAGLLLLNTGFAAPQLADVVEREGAVAILCDAEFEHLADAAPGIPRYFTDGGAGDSLEALIARGRALAPLSPPPAPGRTTVLTSGTTGTPKGARRAAPARALGAVAAVISRIPLRAGERTVIAAPMFHSWGLAHLSDKALRGTDTSSGKRRWMVCVAMLSASVVLLAPLVDSVFLILLLITLSLTGICTGLSLNIALGTDLLQSPADSGKAMGMQITGGNVFGLIAPITTGYIIAYTGSYNWAFIAGGILLLVGAAVTMTLTYSPIGAPPDPRAAIPPSKPLHA